MSKKGVYFNTENNEYFYDDMTGNIILKEKILDDKNESVNKDNIKIIKKVRSKDVEEIIKNIGIKELILIVTEECNLRCKYCVYSGNYDNNRIHKNNYMDDIIAKKAIHKYLNECKQFRKSNLFFKPIIGFFGGEPLLNFNVIKEAVRFSKDIYKEKILYTMTTNAMLLTEEKLDFLVKNNFLLVISLNGDRYENDRLRVDIKNSGSFDRVISNMKRLYEKYPQYYKENVSIAATFDNGTDMIKLREFFNTNELVKEKLTVLSKVIDQHTSWYDRYSIEENKKYEKEIVELKEIFFKSIKANEPVELFLKKLLALPYFNILNRSINQELSEYKPKIQPYSGACIPGSKLAVDYNGKLHLCEKINSKIPIGDVDGWIDYNKISALINRFNSYMSNYCEKCPIQRLCPVCYKDIINDDGSFTLDYEICEKYISGQKRLFSEVYNLLEKGVQASEFLHCIS
ncbi:MAG: radical SAM protein [Clostridium sp.]|uniref:radical SAM protein n=1 Tax=Clostridium TaxID=1485 RepID=UPI002432BA1C|nr:MULTISPECIES: radical SAM protein [Clostridium]MDU5210704.1 radical SAM protein [Clostridium sp.]MDU6762150.1 radical SAM protein [Clostridium sp.]